jgi:hypothetical protein
MHVRRSIVMAVAAVCLMAAGCKKDDGGGTAATKGALQLMPKDSDVVVGIDFGKLRSSDLYKKYEPQLMTLIGDKLGKFKELCGWDPIPKLTSVTMAVRGAKGDQDVTGLIVGFKKDEVTDCLKKAADKAKADGKPGELKVDGDYVELVGAKEPVAFMFVGDGILLARRKGSDAMAGKDVLTGLTKQAEADSVLGSTGFMDVYGKTRTSDALWFVVNGAAASMAQMPVKMNVAFGSVDVSDGLAIDSTGRMANEADAKQAGEMATKALDQAKAFGLFKDSSVDVSGNDLHVKVAMTSEQIEQLAGMAKGMLGGRMGRRGGGDPAPVDDGTGAP